MAARTYANSVVRRQAAWTRHAKINTNFDTTWVTVFITSIINNYLPASQTYFLSLLSHVAYWAPIVLFRRCRRCSSVARTVYTRPQRFPQPILSYLPPHASSTQQPNIGLTRVSASPISQGRPATKSRVASCRAVYLKDRNFSLA